MRTFRSVAIAFTILLPAACSGMQRTGSSEAVLRAAQDVPSAFTTPEGVMPEDGCRTTMVDPRDQSPIRLVRSAQHGMTFRGDFEVADGRYGVREGELLRVDCATGQTLGIVRN
jgi:hypothetical protein